MQALLTARSISARANSKYVEVAIGGFDFADYWPDESNPVMQISVFGKATIPPDGGGAKNDLNFLQGYDYPAIASQQWTQAAFC